MYQELPKDPAILLSFINTQLRDAFSTLDSLCSAFQIEREVLEKKLMSIGYSYHEETNQFI